MARVALVVGCVLAVGIGALVFVQYDLTHQMSLVGMKRAMPIEPPPRWSITGQIAAHRVYVAHVETEFLNEAVAITQEIAEALKGKQFAEILVYFHRPGRPDALPPRRVQWSPTQGFVETVY